MAELEKYHAKPLKGPEELLADELRSLGAKRIDIGNRGVTFYGGRSLLYRVNLASRLTLRVLVPIIEFDAADAETLYKHVRRYDWSLHLNNKMTFAVDPVVHSPHFRNRHVISLYFK